MTKIRQPDRVKDRSDDIADHVAAAGEKLVELATEWFELNDPEALDQARGMLNANEVTLMLSVHSAPSGLAHVALNLLRTDSPMPKPLFEVRVPMLRWAMTSMNQRISSAPRSELEFFFSEERRQRRM